MSGAGKAAVGGGIALIIGGGFAVFVILAVLVAVLYMYVL